MAPRSFAESAGRLYARERFLWKFRWKKRAQAAVVTWALVCFSHQPVSPKCHTPSSLYITAISFLQAAVVTWAQAAVQAPAVAKASGVSRVLFHRWARRCAVQCFALHACSTARRRRTHGSRPTARTGRRAFG